MYSSIHIPVYRGNHNKSDMTNQLSQASQVSKMNIHKITAYARIQNDGTEDEHMQDYHSVIRNTSSRFCFDPNIHTDSGAHPVPQILPLG